MQEHLKAEMDRVIKTMAVTKPDDEKYGILEARFKTLFAMYMSIEKAEMEKRKQDSEDLHRDREYKFKIDSEKARREQTAEEFERAKRLDESRSELDNAKLKLEQEKFEHEKQQAEARAKIDEWKMDVEYEKLTYEQQRNEIEKDKLKAEQNKAIWKNAMDLLMSLVDGAVTLERCRSGVAVALISAKVTCALGKSIFTDESSNNLVFSKLFNQIPKAPFVFKLL